MVKSQMRGSLFLALAGLLLLSACGLGDGTPARPRDRENDEFAESGKLFGENGLVLFGGEQNNAPEGAALGVNAFLWRASLDTISFMPLVQADPAGGVIITDWYTPPEASNERYKMNVFILDRQLRADGVRVSVFREVKDAAGNWASASTGTETGTQIENAILKRARQMRIDSLAQQNR